MCDDLVLEFGTPQELVQVENGAYSHPVVAQRLRDSLETRLDSDSDTASSGEDEHDSFENEVAEECPFSYAKFGRSLVSEKDRSGIVFGMSL